MCGQIYNKEVEAKISMSNSNEYLEISGTAFNKSEITQSLRYVLSVIKKNEQNSNTSKNDQGGRIVLEASEKKSLSKTTINADAKDRIIILLLIYDLDDKLVGKDRVVINDINESEDNALQSIMEDNQLLVKTENKSEVSVNEDVNQEARDGIELTGIVTENTKTKPGMDFYKLFYSNYSSKDINGSKVVNINEIQAFGINTKIEIVIDNTVIWEFFARPKYDYLKSMAEVAVQRVNAYFQNMERNAQIVRRY